MKINPATLMFEDIPDDVVQDMFDVAEGLLLRGVIPNPHPAWMTEWFEAGGFGPDRQLLVLSTVLPARVLLSLLHRSGFRAGACRHTDKTERADTGYVYRCTRCGDWGHGLGRPPTGR